LKAYIIGLALWYDQKAHRLNQLVVGVGVVGVVLQFMLCGQARS
jgi:hypothetical protein